MWLLLTQDFMCKYVHLHSDRLCIFHRNETSMGSTYKYVHSRHPSGSSSSVKVRPILTILNSAAWTRQSRACSPYKSSLKKKTLNFLMEVTASLIYESAVSSVGSIQGKDWWFFLVFSGSENRSHGFPRVPNRLRAPLVLPALSRYFLGWWTAPLTRGPERVFHQFSQCIFWCGLGMEQKLYQTKSTHFLLKRKHPFWVEIPLLCLLSRRLHTRIHLPQIPV